MKQILREAAHMTDGELRFLIVCILLSVTHGFALAVWCVVAIGAFAAWLAE